jgi:5-methylcytosine-specific restriction endonuclease McrA
MARKRVAKLLRQTIAAQASYRCGYCLTPQSVTAMPMHVEHIISVAAGGTTAEDNLWLACPLCNGYKGARTQAIDPLSGETVGLFNPREQTGQITLLGARMGSRSLASRRADAQRSLCCGSTTTTW